ncbi:hypothetical protein V6C20_07925 [Caldibacillus thermoamylovorans]
MKGTEKCLVLAIWKRSQIMLIAIIVMIQVLLIVPAVMVQDYWIKLRHLEMLSESVSQSASL